MSTTQNDNFRWYILGLSFLSSTFVSAIPFSCLPVLFEEIGKDLNLSLVQLGSIWGIANLATMFVSLIAGLLGDRFGVRIILGLASVMVGLTGALRGFSDSFFLLALTVFLNGFFRAIIPINITKLTVSWFKDRNLGVANAFGAMGMGFGLMLGPMISATVLSPWLGGWRNVMFFWGAISLAIGSLWFIFARMPKNIQLNPQAIRVPFKEIFPKLVRNKIVWLVGLALTFRMAGIQGMTGYLPLFLRGQGWSEASADGALSLFYALSTVGVIPLAALSDRIGLRKPILLAGLVIMTIALAILPVVNASTVWVLMVVSGLFMDAFMSILMTTLLESKGIEISNAGTAMGLAFTIGPIGSVVAPPLGNSLAPINGSLPFIFWASLSLIGIITVLTIKETGWRVRKGVGKNQQPSIVS